MSDKTLKYFDSTACKFRNARSAFRNLHVDPLSLHNSMRNKQVEFNSYIYTLTTLSKLNLLATKYPFFNTKHPVIILRASLFVVTPSHVASSKIECQNFSYVYRSRKHWECKYHGLHVQLHVSWKFLSGVGGGCDDMCMWGWLHSCGGVTLKWGLSWQLCCRWFATCYKKYKNTFRNAVSTLKKDVGLYYKISCKEIIFECRYCLVYFILDTERNFSQLFWHWHSVEA